MSRKDAKESLRLCAPLPDRSEIGPKHRQFFGTGARFALPGSAELNPSHHLLCFFATLRALFCAPSAFKVSPIYDPLALRHE